MVSIILPSIRPDNMINCLKGIVNGSVGVEIEVILVTDFPINLAEHTIENLRIKWIYEKERKGTVEAIIRGYKIASGDYIFLICDEAITQPGCLLNLKNYCLAHDNKVLLSPKHIPEYPFFYYGKWFAAFPFAHKDLFKSVGGIFLPEFKSFYADPDLSLRTYAAGYEVKECPTAIIYHDNRMDAEGHQHNVNQYLEQDRATFRSRWDHLGEFRDP